MTSKSRLPVVLSIIVSVFVLFSASSFAINISITNNQNRVTATDFVPTATPGDNGEAFQTPPTLSPDEEISETEYAAERARKFNARTIFDFHIAYLVKHSTVSPDNLISSENISRLIEAKVVYSWEEFVQINEQQPFQVVFIHSSMYDQVDKIWMREAYRRTVLIIGINVSFEQLATLTNDNCLTDPNPGSTERFENTYLLFTYFVDLENESHRDFINTRELETCSDEPLGSYVYVRHGTINAPILDASFLDDLVTTLVLLTVDFDIPVLSKPLALPTSQTIPLPTFSSAK